jgi:hypothetical protein
MITQQLALPAGCIEGCALCTSRREPHDWHEDENWISHACQFPADQQAQIVPRDRGRRHPHDGIRPEWSGYCVIGDCNCTCHEADEVPINALEP